MSRPSASAVDKQLAVISAQIELLRAQEFDLQNHIEIFKRTKDTIRQKRQALEHEQADFQDSLYPINWLPAELIISIFLAFDEDVFTLTHVCRKWRELAVSTPRLWSRIAPYWHSSRLETAIERSQDTLLDVEHNGQNRADIALLFKHMNRTRSMDLTIPMQKVLPTFCFTQFTPSQATTLEHLALRCPPLRPIVLSDFDRDWHTEYLTHNPPNESRVHLASLELMSFPLPLISPYLLTNLRDLTISYPSYKDRIPMTLMDFLRILKWTPNLTALSLVNTPMIPWPSPSYDVILPVLTVFKWDDLRETIILALFTHLHLPSIVELDIRLQSPALPQVHHPPAITEKPSVDALTSISTLSLKAPDPDVMCGFSRKFNFPNLETIELTCTNLKAEPSTLPKMESIFRHPLHTHLTHLVLTAYTLEGMPTMLGYTPALRTLSVDACLGVNGVFEAMKQGRCPELEDMSFWDCPDLLGEEMVKALIMRDKGVSLDPTGTPKERRTIRKLPGGRFSAHTMTPEAKKPKMIYTLLIESCALVSERVAKMVEVLGVEVTYRACEEVECDE